MEKIDKIKLVFHRIVAFVKTRFFLFNLFSAVGAVLILFTIVYLSLGSYTHHGHVVEVPDFKGLTPDKLDNFVEDKNIQYAIIDSSYDPHLPKGTVIDQDPDPHAIVKIGRTIYLTINKVTPPQVKIPNLINVSYKQAEAILLSYGLKIGKLIYKPDYAKNAVLDMLADGKSIKAGTYIKKETVIDLVLGDGLGDSKVLIPNLIGLTLEEAQFVLKGSSLNVGAVMYDESVKDSSLAHVYKQIPPNTSPENISQGEAVDLFLSQTPGKQ
jgi:beta-lactam-binding protein with PASTA domain